MLRQSREASSCAVLVRIRTTGETSPIDTLGVALKTFGDLPEICRLRVRSLYR